MADTVVAKNPIQQALLDKIASGGGNQQTPSAPVVTAKNPTQQAMLDKIKEDNPSYVSDTARGAVSGLAEGTAFAANTPSMLVNLANAGYQKGQKYLPESLQGGDFSVPEVDESVRSGLSDLTGGYTEYDPKYLLGKIAKNVGTMAPTAAAIGLTGGLGAVPTALTAGALLPGVAGTLAGEGTELASKKLLGASDEDAERLGGYAKIGAEVLSPFAAGKFLGLSKSVVGPQALETEKNLIKNGVKPPTTGQLLQDPEIMAREASSLGFANTVKAQQDSFVDFAYREAGWKGKGVPTKSQFENFMRESGEGIEKTISRIDYDVPQTFMSKVLDPKLDAAIQKLDPNTSADFSKLLGELSSGQLSAKEINSIRSRAWELYRSDVASQSPIVKDIAKNIGSISDDIIKDNLERKVLDGGRTYNAYLARREKYANLLAINDARVMSGRPSAMRFSPQNMYEASRGISASSDNLKSVSEDAMSFFTNHPNVPQPKTIGDAALDAAQTAAFTNAPIGAAQFAKDMLKKTVGLSHPFTMTKAGQASMRNMAGSGSSAIDLAKRVMPAASVGYQEMNREGRKAGGRVSSHDMAADQLVRAAERAKKGLSAQTEPLLNQSDETVVKALEVANRSI